MMAVKTNKKVALTAHMTACRGGTGSYRGHSITASISRMVLAVTRGHSITANISRVVLAVTGVTVSQPTSAEWYWQIQVKAGCGEQSSRHCGR